MSNKFSAFLTRLFSRTPANSSTCSTSEEPTQTCFYKESHDSIQSTHDALMTLVADTSEIAKALTAKLENRPPIIANITSEPRARRLEDLHICRDEIGSVYSALNSSADAICMTDVRGKILFANDRFLETYGLKPKDIIGSPISIIGAGENSKHMFEDMWQTILDSKIWTGLVKNRNKNTGEVIKVESSIMPIHGRNRVPDYFVCIQTVIKD